MDEAPFDQLKLVLARLERISADSVWAHRASGVRGALLRAVEDLEAGKIIDQGLVNLLARQGLKILDLSAREKIRKGMVNQRP